MKNILKILSTICVLCLVLLTVVVVCRLMIPHPSECPNSKWVTKDGTVCFYVEKDEYRVSRYISGIIQVGSNVIDGTFTMSPQAGCVDVYTPDAYDRLKNGEVEYSFEFWTEVYVGWTCYIVEVKDTTYFEKGQILIFYRTD